MESAGVPSAQESRGTAAVHNTSIQNIFLPLGRGFKGGREKTAAGECPAAASTVGGGRDAVAGISVRAVCGAAGQRDQSAQIKDFMGPLEHA